MAIRIGSDTQTEQGRRTGGYTGPQPRTPRTPRKPRTYPGQTAPQAAPREATRQPGGGVGAPETAGAGPSALGITPTGRTEILDQMVQAEDQEVFQQQFSNLMNQRALIGTPARIDPNTRYHYPSEEQAEYYRKWTNEAVAYLTAPPNAGGQGMSPPQARMMAVAELRRRFPQIDPHVWPSITAEKEGKLFPKATMVDPKGPTPPIEFGAARAARITPPKVAEIITRPDFAEYSQWAQEYKGQAGVVANAEGFADFAIQKKMAQGATEAADEDVEIQAGADALVFSRQQIPDVLEQWKALDKAYKAGVDPQRLAPQAQTLGVPVDEEGNLNFRELPKMIAGAELAMETAGEAGAEDAQAGASEWFAKHAHVLSVAAALAELY